MRPKLNWNKLLLWCLIALSLLFITGSLIITYWEPVLKKHIKESIYNSTDKLYRVEFDDIGFNVFTGSLSIKNLQLIPDMSIYRQLKSKKQHPRYLFNLYIQKFKFSGINIYEYYVHDELQIDELSINHPDVLVINDILSKELSDTNSNLRHPYELIKNELKS
ncbi:MAG: hypothetical protein ACK45U_01510, partial [bacterium]